MQINSKTVWHAQARVQILLGEVCWPQGSKLGVCGFGGFSSQVLWFVYGIVWATELWNSRVGVCEDHSVWLVPWTYHCALTDSGSLHLLGTSLRKAMLPRLRPWSCHSRHHKERPGGTLLSWGVSCYLGVSPCALPLAPNETPSLYPVEMLEQSWWGTCTCPMPWHSFPLSPSPEGAWPGSC